MRRFLASVLIVAAVGTFAGASIRDRVKSLEASRIATQLSLDQANDRLDALCYVVRRRAWSEPQNRAEQTAMDFACPVYRFPFGG
jgi:hypothetical protein